MSVTTIPVRNNFRKGKLIFRGFRSTMMRYLHSWQPHTVVEVIYLPNMTREQTGMTGSLSFRALVTTHFCQHVPPCKGSADSQNSTISQGTSLQNVSLGETLQTQTVTQSQLHPSHWPWDGTWTQGFRSGTLLAGCALPLRKKTTLSAVTW